MSISFLISLVLSKRKIDKEQKNVLGVSDSFKFYTTYYGKNFTVKLDITGKHETYTRYSRVDW